jgi:hypothetical protein
MAGSSPLEAMCWTDISASTDARPIRNLASRADERVHLH